ncbi:MAG: NAD(P)H-hydrate dehydratase [Chlamydiota bacterium]|nr:NAD(P)H-hydrate dehydratase [Chlamydiota bacterium]
MERALPIQGGCLPMESCLSYAEALAQKLSPLRGLLCIAGEGPLGDLAIAIAILLHETGKSPQLLPLSTHSSLLSRYRKKGGQCVERIATPSHILEAICWGQAPEQLAGMIQEVNGLSLPIHSLALPSGISPEDGSLEGAAIQATETWILPGSPIGLFLAEGYTQAGRLHPLPPIGAQREGIAALPLSEDIAGWLPPLIRSRHKYEAGSVRVVTGDRLSGAGRLAAWAAMRTGTGLSTLSIRGEAPPPPAPPYEVITESYALPSKSFPWESGKSHSATLIGPGWGHHPDHHILFESLMGEEKLVIDADALPYSSGKIKGRQYPAILTPHHGEMSRILNVSSCGGRESLQLCQEKARQEGTLILLKGAPSLLFFPEGIPWILPFGNPGMATAGSGDVLAGIIVSLLSQGVAPKKAAALGAWLHGRAGDIAAERLSPYSLMASDIIETIPQAILSIEERN